MNRWQAATEVVKALQRADKPAYALVAWLATLTIPVTGAAVVALLLR